jgi:hypothetical protein
VSGAEAAGLYAGRSATRLTDAVGDLMRQAAAEVLIPRFGALTDHEREEKSAGEG